MSALLDLGVWVPILDGDRIAADAYNRHYASERSRERRIERETLLTMGPGQKLLLSTPCRRAHFAWRVFIDDSGQSGVNCAWFFNEGAGVASDLVRAADTIADMRWPGLDHYTYVDEDKVRGNPPGNSFLHAGWRYVLERDENGHLARKRTKERGLLILERRPIAVARAA